MRYVQNPEFMKRANKEDAPYIQNKDGSRSTHLMAAEKINGEWYAFPTIVERDGVLEKLTTRKAFNAAKDTGDIMRFGKDKKGALEFAKGGYKKNTPLEGSLLGRLLR